MEGRWEDEGGRRGWKEGGRMKVEGGDGKTKVGGKKRSEKT